MMPVFLTNALLLVLWLRLLPQRDEKAFFNPYIAGGLNLADRLVRFLQPVLGVLPPYAVAAAVLVFLLAFRGVAAAGAGLDWFEPIGLWRFAAPLRSPSRCLLFSLVGFLWLLHRLWTLDWVLTLLRRRRRETRASAALAALAMPVSALPPLVRGFFLLLLGAGIGAALAWIGLPAAPLSETAGALLRPPVPTDSLPVLLVFSLGAIADVLGVASQLVLLFILLSFLGALLRSQPALTIGNEGIDLLVGSVFSSPLQVGGFSLAPILFFLGAGFLHSLLLSILLQWLQQAGA